MLAGPDQGVDLARAALLIAREEYPELDLRLYLDRLDEMAGAVRRRLAAEPGAADVIAVLNGYLFEQEGFHGNEQDTTTPQQLLNEVLDRRPASHHALHGLHRGGAARRVAAVGVGLPATSS